MTATPRAADLRGATRLVVDATLRVSDIVEAMHAGIARPWAGIAGPAPARARGIARLVYASIRTTTRLVGSGLDAVLSTLPAQASDLPADGRESLLAILNGVLGDHLAATANPLAIPFELRHDGRPLPLAESAAAVRAAISAARPRVVVLVHGLCRSDRHWRRAGHDHGAALAAELDASAVYACYNSGLHVSTNGRALRDHLAALVERWPVRVQELAIVGHSMGGLVARAACHHATRAGDAWLRRLRHLVFLGTPHHGAPLERGGQWLHAALGAAPFARPLARLGTLRSAGITDLRHGNLRDEDWQGRDRFARTGDPRQPVPLPEGVACGAIAGTLGQRPGGGRGLPGDGLVPVASALGHHRDPAFTLAVPAARQRIVRDTSHLELLSSAEVFAILREWLTATE